MVGRTPIRIGTPVHQLRGRSDPVTRMAEVPAATRTIMARKATVQPNERRTKTITTLTAASWSSARAAVTRTLRARPNPARLTITAAAPASMTSNAASGQPTVTVPMTSVWPARGPRPPTAQRKEPLPRICSTSISSATRRGFSRGGR